MPPARRCSSGWKNFSKISRSIPTAKTRRNKGDVVTRSSTMHSCKGLEFPRVFIVGLEGRLAATHALGGGRHAGRGAAAVLRGRHARDAVADHQPLREPEKYGQLLPCHPLALSPKELPPELVEARRRRRIKKPVSETVGKSLFGRDAGSSGLKVTL